MPQMRPWRDHPVDVRYVGMLGGHRNQCRICDEFLIYTYRFVDGRSKAVLVHTPERQAPLASGICPHGMETRDCAHCNPGRYLPPVKMRRHRP